MCYLCEEYGDPGYGGGVWYLNPQNYGRNMYKLRMPGGGVTGFKSDGDVGQKSQSEAPAGPTLADLVDALDEDRPEEYARIKEEMLKREVSSQVVTLKEADSIMELCSPMATMSCGCRKFVRAVDERSGSEYTCMGFGVGMFKWERWPERYKGGVRFVDIDEAREWNHEMDKRGFVHILMLFGAPYIGGLCQCDYPDCGLLRSSVDFGIGTLKGHYVAFVDYDICNGCGMCGQRCQYGALKIEVTTGRANIDQFKCFGCGICETGCSRGAIKMVERKTLPALAEVWL